MHRRHMLSVLRLTLAKHQVELEKYSLLHTSLYFRTIHAAFIAWLDLYVIELPGSVQ